MKCRALFLAVTAAATLSATGISALTIDAFDDRQSTSAPPTSAIEAAAPVLGGFREIEAFASIFTDGSTTVASNRSGSGYFSIDNDFDTSGGGTLTYDGQDLGANISVLQPNGLGGIDLTDGGVSGGFLFDVIGNDFAFDYALSVWSDGETDTVIGTIGPGSGGSVVDVNFSLFSGIDFMDVGAIQLSFAGGIGSDLLIDNFRTGSTPGAVVPLPATGLLLLVAIGALGRAGRSRAFR